MLKIFRKLFKKKKNDEQYIPLLTEEERILYIERSQNLESVLVEHGFMPTTIIDFTKISPKQ